MTEHSQTNRDVHVRVGELRAIVGPVRRRRRGQPASRWPQPPTWLVLGKRPADGSFAPTLAFGTFRVSDVGELVDVVISNGPLSPDIQQALLEAGRNQWARR